MPNEHHDKLKNVVKLFKHYEISLGTDNFLWGKDESFAGLSENEKKHDNNILGVMMTMIFKLYIVHNCCEDEI